MLFEQLRPYVRMLTHASCPQGAQSRQDDSDLIQDSLLVAHRALPRFRGETVAQFVAWLRTVTQRTVARSASVHTSAQRRDLSREQAVADLEQLPAAIVDDGASERAAAVAAAIEALPEDMRILLLGRFFDDLSYAELSAQLERSEGALRVLHTRALRRLRERMTGDREL